MDGNRLEFRLPGLDGRLVSSADSTFTGKVVLVDLWGTWCPPCLSEIPTFNDLMAKFASRGLVIVGIAFERETDPEKRRRHLREFVSAKKISYLVLDGGSTGDFSLSLPSVRNVKGFPVEIVVGRDGRVVDARNSYGFKKRWARELTKEIERLLAEPAPASSSAGTR